MEYYLVPRSFLRFMIFSTLTLFVLAWATRPVHAATITVNSEVDNLTAGNSLCTLREAIMNANLVAGGDTTGGDCAAGAAGADTIIFDSSLDGVAITLSLIGANNDNTSGDLDINGSLTITGNGSSNTIVDANGIDRVFHIPGAGHVVVFNDLTIRNGILDDGAGIANNASDVTINNSIIMGNAATDDGGGISNFGGRMVINSSTIADNSTTGGATSHGGGIRNDGSSTLTINDSTISGNSTTIDGNGGGIFNTAGSILTLNNSVMNNNTAVGDGGAIANDASGDVTINGGVISSNSASDDGGAISNFGSIMTIDGTTLEGNQTTGSANSHGGAIRNDFTATLIISYSSIMSNTITMNGSGGGVFNTSSSTTSISHSTIRANSATDDGGGVFSDSGSVTIDTSTIHDNTAVLDGGGISIAGGVLTLSTSTLSGNRSGRNGGGIVNNAATVHLNYVTITNNVADFDLGVVGNGGGIRHTNGAVSNFTSTIIIGNDDRTGSANDDCSVFGATLPTTNGYNMRAASTGCTDLNAGTDIVTATPGLGTLQDNGGDTETHALLGSSPAIDWIPSGTNGCGTTYTTDQRGVTRLLDGDADTIDECDIGAYEAGAAQCGIQAAAETGTYTFGNISIDIDDDGLDLDCLRVTHLAQNHPNATPGMQGGQFWKIEALQSDLSTAATSGYIADLTLPHNVTPDSNAQVCKWLEGTGPGAGWDCGRTSSTATTVRRDAVPGFSDWTVGDSVGPTAVALSNVTSTQTIPIFALLMVILISLASWRLVRVHE